MSKSNKNNEPTPEPADLTPIEPVVSEDDIAKELGAELYKAIKSEDPVTNINHLYNHMRSKLGVEPIDFNNLNKPAEPAKKVDLPSLPEPSDYADDEVKTLYNAVKALMKRDQERDAHYNETLTKLQKQQEKIAEEASVINLASSSAEKVSLELGVRLTPAHVKEAMLQTGIKDPVKACWTHFMNDILKAKKQPGKQGSITNDEGKPNNLTSRAAGNADINLDDLTPAQRWQLKVQDAAAKREYLNNQ